MTKTIWFDKDLLRSPAFRSLKRWSMLVYLDFLRKRQMEPVKRVKRSDEWVIKNNGDIVYPYSEAEKKGIGRREFRNAIDELIEKGFLDIDHQGSGGRAGDMTKYFLDDRWKDYGTSSFRPARNPRRKDTRKGRGWSAYHAKQKKSSITKSIPETNGSSNRSDTRKMINGNLTDCNSEENPESRQLSLWSNNLDTIL